MADTKISGATALNTTGVISAPVAVATNTTAFRRVDNISASSSPTVNEDSGDGYHAGSMWYRVDTGELFVCRSASVGAAVWTKLGISQSHYIAGNYYNFPQALPVNAATVVTATQDVIKAFPFRLESRITISHLTYRVGIQNGNLAVAIYNSRSDTGYLGTVLGSSAAGAVGASGGTREVALTSAVQIEAGVTYWAAINFSGSTTTTTACSPGGLGLLAGYTLDGNIGGTGSNNFGLNYNTQTCGTWNDLSATSPSGVLLNTATHCMGFKCSAVP